MLLITVFVSQSMSQTYIERTFDFDSIDYAADVIKLNNGEFLLLSIASSNSGRYNVFQFLDQNGNTIQTMETPYYGGSIVEFDSCFYIAGSIDSSGALYKLDKNLNLIWAKNFQNDYGWVNFGSINQINQQRLIYSFKVTPYDSWFPPYDRLAYCDTSGNILWKKGEYLSIRNISVLSNGNIFSVGEVYNNDPFTRIMNYDTLGTNNYSTSIGEDYDIIGSSVMFNDTALLILDVTSIGSENDYIKLFNVNTNNGNIIWEKITFINNSSTVNTACHGLNNEILAAGTCKRDNKNAAFIFRFNSNGDSISTSYIDKYHDLRPSKIISYDNSFYMIGTLFKQDGTRDGYFLKAPLDTVLVKINKPSITEQLHCKIYPNPANDKLFITYSGLEKLIQYKLFNSSGQVVLNDQFNQSEIDVSNLNPGLYIIELEFDNQIISKKIIIE